METTLIWCTSVLATMMFACFALHNVLIRRDLEGIRSTLEIEALSRNMPKPDPSRAQALKDKLGSIERRLETVEAMVTALYKDSPPSG